MMFDVNFIHCCVCYLGNCRARSHKFPAAFLKPKLVQCWDSAFCSKIYSNKKNSPNSQSLGGLAHLLEPSRLSHGVSPTFHVLLHPALKKPRECYPIVPCHPCHQAKAAFHQQFLIILAGTQEIAGQHGVLEHIHMGNPWEKSTGKPSEKIRHGQHFSRNGDFYGEVVHRFSGRFTYPHDQSPIFRYICGKNICAWQSWDIRIGFVRQEWGNVWRRRMIGSWGLSAEIWLTNKMGQ